MQCMCAVPQYCFQDFLNYFKVFTYTQQIQAGMPGYTLDVERMKDTTINAETASEPQANPTPQPAGSGWNLLVQAIDRILFVVYLLIMCIYFLAYIGGAASKRT